jgi:hypothetical protein
MSKEKEFFSNLEGMFPFLKARRKNRYWLHILLFLITAMTVVMSGTFWSNHDASNILNWQYGITYAILILTFISAHEFGHYFAARIHRVDATLPFYLPAPSELMPFGTFGAVIKTRSAILSKKALFDIGVAGPLAGFLVSLLFLIIGLMTLPSKDSIYQIHPGYLIYFGKIPDTGLHFGDTLLFKILSEIFVKPGAWLPPMNEIYHFPFLNVGWFGLFVTALNMLPIGQLDGGHVTYAMFGIKQGRLARIFWWIMFTLGLMGVMGILYNEYFIVESPDGIYGLLKSILYPPLDLINTYAPWAMNCWAGWIFWALITRLFIKLDHPPIGDDTPLDSKRMLIGWIALIVLALSFSYNGIYFK